MTNAIETLCTAAQEAGFWVGHLRVINLSSCPLWILWGRWNPAEWHWTFCNRVLILVFLTKNRGLFKLLLRGKWQELVLMVRKSFHPITNSLPMWPEVFLFQEAIAEFLESHLVLMVTNPSVAGKNHRSTATRLCSKAVLGLLFHRIVAFCGCQEALGKGCLTRAE